MAKMKSHSGTKKRFRVTASGKVKHKQQGKNHIATTKSPKRVRNLRQNAFMTGVQADTIKGKIQG